MATVTLRDIPSNPTEVYVDDLILVKGRPADLSDDQIKRVTDTGAELDTGDGYGSQSKDELEAAAAARNLEVEGTGSGGNVTKGDLVAALEAADEEAGS